MLKLKSFIAIVPCILLSWCTASRNESAFFHADASHSGYYGTKGISVLHGVKWSFRTAGKIFSSPVISENTLFIGSDDSCVYALDAGNGKLLWKFKTGGRVSSTVAVHKDKVYVVSFDGFIYCIEKDSGNEIWKFKTAGENVFAAPGIHGLPGKKTPLADPWDMFLSSPVVAEGNVFFGCGAGVFYALDCDSGHKVWEFNTNGVIHSSPAYSDSTVYFGSWDSYLYALNSGNGLLKWKYKTGIDTVYYNQVGFQSSPVIYNGLVYSGCRDSYIRANDMKTGDLKWKYFNNGSWIIVTPALHNDTLIFTTSDTHKFIALNAVDGKLLYQTDCRTYGFSSPAITGNIVYLGNFGGSLMAFRTGNGDPVWEFKTEAAKFNRDSILTEKGEFDFPKIYKENSYQGMIKSMEVLYSVGSILSSPAIYDGRVYFGSTDGFVYSLY